MASSNLTSFISEDVFVRYSFAHRSLMSHLLLEGESKPAAVRPTSDATPSVSSPIKKRSNVDIVRQQVKSNAHLSNEEHSFYLSLQLNSKATARLAYPRANHKLQKESPDIIALIYKLHTKVVEEQASFLKAAEKSSSQVPMCLKLHSASCQFRKDYLEASSERAIGYARCYHVKDLVPLMPNSLMRSTFSYINTVLQMGIVPYLILPKIDGTTVIPQGYRNIMQRYPIAKSEDDIGNILLKTVTAGLCTENQDDCNKIYSKILIKSNRIQPVSQDSNAEKLAQKYEVQIVLSSSSLRTLFANSHLCLENTWDVPVIVRESQKDGDQSAVQKIVYIDKAFPNRNVSILNDHLAYQKRALKNKLLHSKHIKAHRFSDTSIKKKPIDVADKQNKISDQSRVAELSPMDTEMDETDEEKLIIDDDDTPKEKDMGRTESRERQKTSFERNKSNDEGSAVIESTSVCKTLNSKLITDQSIEIDQISEVSDVPPTIRRSTRIRNQANTIVNPTLHHNKGNEPSLQAHTSGKRTRASLKQVSPKMNTLDEIERLQTELLGDYRRAEQKKEQHVPLIKENEKDYAQPSNENVTYQLWKLGRLKVMVRCSVDGVTRDDNTMVFWKVQPKLEYRPKVGGEVLSYTECAKQWIGTTIRPDCKLARVRMDAFSCKVVGLEEMELSQISDPSTGFKNSDCLNVLNAIFQKLVLLPEGSYLLSHDYGEGVVMILKEAAVDSGSPPKGIYDLHANRKAAAAAVDRRETLENIPWHPIDATVMLFSHLRSNRIPATFEAHINNPRQSHRQKKQRRNNC